MNQQDIRQLTELFERVFRDAGVLPGRDTFTSFDPRAEESTATKESLKRQLEKNEKSLEEHEKSLRKINKGISAFIPSLKMFTTKINRSSVELEKEISNQTDSYKVAARGLYQYTKQVGASTKNMSGASDAIHKIEKVLKEITEETKKRKATEKRLSEISSKHTDKALNSVKGFSNINEVITGVSKDLKNTRKRLKTLEDKRIEHGGKLSEVDQKKIDNETKNIEELKKVRDDLKDTRKQLSDEVKGALSSEELIKVIEEAKDPKAKKALQSLYDLSKKNSTNLFSNIDSLHDTIKGMKAGATAYQRDQQNLQISLHKKRLDAQEKFATALAAAFGDTFRKEMSMIQQRQMREGRQFGMRTTAAMMGMSEAEGLQVLDEQRYLIRRMATQQDGVTGAGDFFRSGEFRQEIQQLGHQLGLTGKDAADAVLDVADSMRRFGVDSTEQQLEATTHFLKESHKQFGITQEQMLGLFRDMSSDISLALFGGAENIISSTEAVNEEIELRMRLARVLNQEMEIQKQRVEELNRLRFGDPAEALRTGIMTSILGRHVDVFEGDTDEQARQQSLIRRYIVGDVEGHEREEAALLLERIRLGAGERMAKGDLGERFPLFHIAQRAGVDLQEAAGLRQRMGDREIPETVDEMHHLSDTLAETQDPITELNTAVSALIKSIEKLNGVMQSSAGSIAGAVANFGTQMAAAYIMGRAMGGAPLIGGRFRGMGRRIRGMAGAAARSPATRAVPGVGAALTVGGAAYQVGQLQEDRESGKIEEEKFRQEVGQTIGSATGVLSGAAAGAILGAGTGPGALVTVPVGALVGAGIGGFAGRQIGGIGRGPTLDDAGLTKREYDLEIRSRLSDDKGVTSALDNISDLRMEIQRLESEAQGGDRTQREKARKSIQTLKKIKSKLSKSVAESKEGAGIDIREEGTERQAVLEQLNLITDDTIGEGPSQRMGYSIRHAQARAQGGEMVESMADMGVEGLKKLGEDELTRALDFLDDKKHLDKDEEVSDMIVEALEKIRENTGDTTDVLIESKDLQKAKDFYNRQWNEQMQQMKNLRVAANDVDEEGIDDVDE